MPDADTARLRRRVLDALATVADADGPIIASDERGVLAFREPSRLQESGAVLIHLEDDPPTRKHPVQHLRADARNLPVQLDMPGIE